MKRDTANKTLIGGFAGYNSGSIEHSYEVVLFRHNKALTGGFVGRQAGSLFRCYACADVTGLTGGLVGKNDGKIQESLFVYSDDKKKKYHFADEELAISEKALTQSIDKEIFEEASGYPAIRFADDRWIFLVEPDKYKDRLTISIKDAEELAEFRDRVNQGDEAAQNAYVVLQEDIDLKGQIWEPIGNSYGATFQGVFDGKYHTIQNFKVTNTKTQFQGFFGVMRGEVYNLTVDCILRNGVILGGIAGNILYF